MRFVIVSTLLALAALQVSARNIRTDKNEVLAALQEVTNEVDATISQQSQSFEGEYNYLRNFMDESITSHQEMIDQFKNDAETTVAGLLEEATNQNVDISECVDNVVSEIVDMGDVLKSKVRDCYILTDHAVVSTRETFGDVLNNIKFEVAEVGFEIDNCHDDEACINEIAEKVNRMALTAPAEVRGATRVPSYLVSYLKESMAYCYLQPQVDFYLKSGEKIEEATSCAKAKLQ